MRSDDFTLLADIVKRRSGIQVSVEKKYLFESRLLPVSRKHGLGDVIKLVERIRGGNCEGLLEAVVEAMTTNESFFFRDAHPFECFLDHIMPAMLVARAARRHVRIWCAAASTGQEPYSLAMCLDGLGARLSGWRIEILATDISTEALAKAQEGAYTQFEVQRGLPAQKLIKYFERSDTAWCIKPFLRKNITFKHHNLVNGNRQLGNFDIVFIRNVLIYFDLNTKQKILGEIRQMIPDDGYLCLGGTETVIGVTEDFAPIDDKRGWYRPDVERRSARLSKNGSALVESDRVG